MSTTMRDNLEFIRCLSLSSSTKRKALLEKATNKNLKALAELCLNLLQGNIKLSSKYKTKLKRHKTKIEVLANKRVSLKKKKKFLVQKGNGGFLLPLASIALPLVTEILKKTIFKK